MNKALIVTLLSIGVVSSSAVAAFVYSSKTVSEETIMVVIKSYNDFFDVNDQNIKVNGEFKLIIDNKIETYCSINATCIDNESNNNVSNKLADNYIYSYKFNWDTTYDTYFTFTNYEGNFKSGINIDSPIVTWKDNMYPTTKEDRYRLKSTLKDKDIKITFKADVKS